jgi:hypothetical protein
LDTRWVSPGKNGKQLLIPMLCNALLGSPQLYLTGALTPVIPWPRALPYTKGSQARAPPSFFQPL